MNFLIMFSNRENGIKCSTIKGNFGSFPFSGVRNLWMKNGLYMYTYIYIFKSVYIPGIRDKGCSFKNNGTLNWNK